jgi:ammonia channel protein AmtB
MVFMDTTTTIPTGAMAERWNFKNFMIYGFWVGCFPILSSVTGFGAADGWRS